MTGFTKTPTLKLEAGKPPFVGTVFTVKTHTRDDGSTAVILNGDWEGQGNASVFITTFAADQASRDGILGYAPDYAITAPVRLSVEKVLKNGKQYINIRRANASGPVDPYQEAQQATGGAIPAKPKPQPPVAAPASALTWDDLQGVMGRAIRVAKTVAEGWPEPQQQAIAVTLFIEARKHGLKTIDVKPNAPDFNKVPEAVEQDDDPLPF